MQDPFEIMGVSRRFALDEAELERRFVALSSEHHPDRHSDPIAQADAAEKSAEVGWAYQTLANPESRANALLTLRGGPAKEDDKSLPPELLMEVMEVREALESALHEEDDVELARLRDWARSQQTERLSRIAEVLDSGDADAPLDEAAAKQARLELNALRYAQRMIEQMPAQ